MRIRLFFSALALTLLLLLPMIGLVEYFAMQRQMQERVRRANAAGTAVQVDPASRYMGSLLLAVQKEEPEFILLRMDAPAATLTLCGLPGNMQLAAPAAPQRWPQLIWRLARHGQLSCWGYPWYRPTTLPCGHAQLLCQLLGAGHHRAAGYGRVAGGYRPHQNFVAEIEAATAETALRDLGQGRLMPEQPGCWQLTPRPYSAKTPAACRPARPGTAGQCPHFNGFSGAGLEHAGKCIQLFQHRPRAGSGNRPAQLHQPP